MKKSKATNKLLEYNPLQLRRIASDVLLLYHYDKTHATEKELKDFRKALKKCDRDMFNSVYVTRG